jgi:hypothetical protein
MDEQIEQNRDELVRLCHLYEVQRLSILAWPCATIFLA